MPRRILRFRGQTDNALEFGKLVLEFADVNFLCVANEPAIITHWPANGVESGTKG
jgi:hypothetical protein